MARPANVTRQEFSAVAKSLRTHLTECAEGNRKAEEKMDELAYGLQSIQDMILTFKSIAWRAFAGVVGIVVTAALTVLVQNFFAQQTVAEHTDKLVRTNAYATQERQILLQQNAAILEELRKKNTH